MLDFGDIFYIDDKEYVWLWSDGEIIDAAVILGSKETEEVKRFQKRADKKGTSHQKPLFCYVELNTEDYINCSANMIVAAQKGIKLSPSIRSTSKRLNNEDLKDIKNEIIEYKELFKEPLVVYMESIAL